MRTYEEQLAHRPVDEAHVEALAEQMRQQARGEERTYTPEEAGKLARVSCDRILQRIEDGTIKAVKKGSSWLIPESALYAYQRQMWLATVADLANDDEL